MYNRVEEAVRDLVNEGRRRFDSDDVLYYLDLSFDQYMQMNDPENILLNRMIAIAKSKIELQGIKSSYYLSLLPLSPFSPPSNNPWN